MVNDDPDHVETIGYDLGVREPFFDKTAVGRTQVDTDNANLLFALKRFNECNQFSFAFSEFGNSLLLACLRNQIGKGRAPFFICVSSERLANTVGQRNSAKAVSGTICADCKRTPFSTGRKFKTAVFVLPGPKLSHVSGM